MYKWLLCIGSLLCLDLILPDTFVNICLKFSALRVRQLLQVKFECVTLAWDAVLYDLVYAHQLLSVQEVDVVPKSHPLLHCHIFNCLGFSEVCAEFVILLSELLLLLLDLLLDYLLLLESSFLGMDSGLLPRLIVSLLLHSIVNCGHEELSFTFISINS